jgi:hypothetical protein
MLVRTIGTLILAVSVTNIAVSAHEFLKTSRSPMAIRLADRLMPMDAYNELRAAASDPSNSETNLRSALAKNPWDTRSWIGLSVQAEMRGDPATAENLLHQAAAHDIGREPRWALANFYFRQGDQQQFLEWANSYRAVTHDREEGLFRMVAASVPDAHELNQALPHLGCDEMGTAVDVMRAAQQPADELIQSMSNTCKDATSRATLSAMVSDFILEDKPQRAAEIWAGMGQRSTLANADFHSPITGQGFDWRINKSPDVSFRQQGSGVDFDLHDGVADGTVLMFQPVILVPGAHYRLAMNTHGDESVAGAFRWELVELSTGRHLPSSLDEENINNLPNWRFYAPAMGTRSLALALFYRRPEGGLPVTGKFTVQGVQLAQQLDMLPAVASLDHKH